MRSMQFQIKTLQGQYRTAEDQLNRSMQRERDLREQLANSDVSSLISKLRLENKVCMNHVCTEDKICALNV